MPLCAAADCAARCLIFPDAAASTPGIFFDHRPFLRTMITCPVYAGIRPCMFIGLCSQATGSGFIFISCWQRELNLPSSRSRTWRRQPCQNQTPRQKVREGLYWHCQAASPINAGQSGLHFKPDFHTDSSSFLIKTAHNGSHSIHLNTNRYNEPEPGLAKALISGHDSKVFFKTKRH